MQLVLYHFWNRAFPELIDFGPDKTRFTHGTDVVVFYYQPGFRSGWFSIKPGHHVNENPDSRTNPFPSMMVITRGQGMGHIGGKDVELSEGKTLFIPPIISHELTNPFDEPMEGVLLMFGEDA